MAVSPNSIITPQNPYCSFANLIAAAALTSRAPITGVGGLTSLVPTQTNGVQINQLRVKVASSSTGINAALSVYVWIYNGTTSVLFDEIVLGTATSSTTAASYQTDVYYNGFILPSTHSLYVSESVLSNSTLTGIIVMAFGGLL